MLGAAIRTFILPDHIHTHTTVQQGYRALLNTLLDVGARCVVLLHQEDGMHCGGGAGSVYGVMVFYMTCAAIQVLCSAMVVIGVMNDDPILITPFLIKNTIVIALNIIICIIVVVFLYLLNLLLMVAYAYCYGAIIFMWTYFLLTVRAYYYELKRGKSDDHHRLAEHCQVENGHIDI
ncbi:uncharacterized protein LOC123516296 isoform X4 [Portunus trituberculatus]|uniref:uncharacterized protein LOC123516296 isoform X4 n=1 Tax=Portunus trituberculatus TaxID=210409 RepID=UPI001E1CE43C|nr:uncharacterized protein LOC123516296 isoform X4 [Portunus trituberculatus]